MTLLKRAQNALEQRVGARSHDESVLRQSRLWMQAITWGLIGTTGFAVAWLALARTEEIVVAPGTLEPIGAVKEIQMPVGGGAVLDKDTIGEPRLGRHPGATGGLREGNSRSPSGPRQGGSLGRTAISTAAQHGAGNGGEIAGNQTGWPAAGSRA